MWGESMGVKKKAKGSGMDTRGKIYVDCAECVRGGKGDKSCTAGARHKRVGKGMCFCGALMDKYEL